MLIAGPVFTEWYWGPIFFVIAFGPVILALGGALYWLTRRRFPSRGRRAGGSLAVATLVVAAGALGWAELHDQDPPRVRTAERVARVSDITPPACSVPGVYAGPCERAATGITTGGRFAFARRGEAVVAAWTESLDPSEAVAHLVKP